MSEMVERVKTAIAEKLAPAIDLRAPYAKVMVDLAAKAAITAMYKPTNAMSHAGAQFVWFEGRTHDEEDAITTYQAFIDAALAGP